MSDALKTRVSEIMDEALRGYDMSERYRNAEGFVRWGLVEKDIHAAIDNETTRYVALEAALRDDSWDGFGYSQEEYRARLLAKIDEGSES